MIQVGKVSEIGQVEISDMLFTAKGPTAGIVLMEWNLKASAPGAAGMWGMSDTRREMINTNVDL